MLKLLLAITVLTCVYGDGWVPLPAPYTEHCIVGEKNLYPPQQDPVPWYTIDLDKPAGERWNEVIADYKDEIQDLIGVIKNMTYAFFHGKLIQWVDKNMADWDNLIDQPYQDEMKGIAEVANIPLGEIVMYNIFYELNAVCTSIVAEDKKGKLYHARNLDFGIFLGWDTKTHDWEITNKLRKIIVNLEWKKGGKTLYKSVNFAGYIGIYNGLKQNKFTISANERYSLDGGYLGVIEWLAGNKKNAKWMTFLTRETMENADSYAEAVNMLSTTRLLSPVYFIVGGNSSGQGTVLTRSRNGTLHTDSMDLSKPNGWYVLETNYDSWKPPLYLDDRRAPGNKCMQQMGQTNVGFPDIFNMLSSQTNFNLLTAYTVLMQVNEGKFETYIQHCKQPCWFA